MLAASAGGLLERFCQVFLAFVLVLMGPAAGCADTAPRVLRPYEVRDTVELSNFTVPATFSRDGRYFVTVTQRGVLPQGVTDATVWLFETTKVQEAIAKDTPIRAIALAHVNAAVNDDDIISQLAWDESGNGLLFLGRDGRENRQLFRVRLRDRLKTALTPTTQDVVSYGVSASRIAYLAAPNLSPERKWWANDPDTADEVIGTGQPLMQVLFPHYGTSKIFQVWQVRGNVSEPILDPREHSALNIPGTDAVNLMALSPSGSQFITITYVPHVPDAWARYAIPKGADFRPFRPDPAPGAPSADSVVAGEGDYSRALQYQIVDLKGGTHHALLDAPLADFQRGGPDALRAAWSPDGRYVAVSGTYLPLNGNDVSSPTGVCGAAVVDLRSGSVKCVVDHSPDKMIAVLNLSWDSEDRLSVQTSGPSLTGYVLRDLTWQSTGNHPELEHPPLELTVHQSLNEPPVLTANDRAGHAHKVFDPNPQLSAVNLGTATRIWWKDPLGRNISGGLAKPPDFVPGHRYPLVIQTHNFRPRRFFAAGTAETATAGRALTAREMLVLQVDEPDPETIPSWEDREKNGVDIYLAAIDELTAEGLVDPKRVGISGYSSAGPKVAASLTRAPDRFAAAVLANTDAGTLTAYETYVDYIMPTYAAGVAETMAGAKPYGDGLQKWLERAPGFRTDQIHAPVLISAGDPQHLISLWGFYSALRDQGKPVELQYFRNGAHNFTKPLQILAHEEMLVDWFDFWLNGHEDPNPIKAAQYARWRSLRDQRAAALP